MKFNTLAIHSNINLLREPASGSHQRYAIRYPASRMRNCQRGARRPGPCSSKLNVHSGACAPDFPNTSPLATISVAMYKFLLAATLALCQLNTQAALQAPVAAYANMYLDADGNVIKGASTDGMLAVGVPGTVRAWNTRERITAR